MNIRQMETVTILISVLSVISAISVMTISVMQTRVVNRQFISAILMILEPVLQFQGCNADFHQGPPDDPTKGCKDRGNR